MRTRIIVPAALLAALVLDVGWVWAGLAAAPSPDVWTTVLHRLPTLVLAGLVLYALVALVLVAGTIAVDAARVRHRLDRLALPNPWDWTEAFSGTSLSPLAARLLDLAPIDTERSRARIVLQSRFDAAHARRETGQLYSGSLVRAHFVTALALLLIFAGAACVYNGTIAILPAGAPVAPALAAIAILALLGVLGRIVVAAAAEPLIEVIANLPFERLDIELLRRLTGLAEGGEAARIASSGPVLSSAIGKLLERLVYALDEGRNALVEAIANLSREAEALSATMRSMAEERGGERSEPPVDDLSELRTTLTQLAATLEGLVGAGAQLPAGPAGEATARQSEAAALGATRSEISREVRDLLADFK
jgi:hypothetical protein